MRLRKPRRARGDAVLSDRVKRVADYLVGLQDADGYLGTYASERRFMRKQPPQPVSWDGAPSVRTWDIWTHAYLMLGLIEVHRLLGTARHLEAACRIGDLCWRTLTSGGIDITDLGNHHGMSASVLMDPALELHFATGEQRYLDLALRILEQADRNPRLALLTQALAGADASEIATGKAYQLIWNLVALAKLHRATGDARYLSAVVKRVAQHPRPSPHARRRPVGRRRASLARGVQSCKRLQSVRLRRDLLDAGVDPAQSRVARDHGRGRVRGRDRAHRVQRPARRAGARRRGLVLLLVPERPAHPHDVLAVLQVQRRDGARRVVFGRVRDHADGVQINMLGPSEAALQVRGVGMVRLEQRPNIRSTVRSRFASTPQRSATFKVHVRIPQWAARAGLRVNGASVSSSLRPLAPSSRSSANGARRTSSHSRCRCGRRRTSAPRATRRNRARPTMRRCARKFCISTTGDHARTARLCDRTARRLQDRRDAARPGADRRGVARDLPPAGAARAGRARRAARPCGARVQSLLSRGRT